MQERKYNQQRMWIKKRKLQDISQSILTEKNMDRKVQRKSISEIQDQNDVRTQGLKKQHTIKKKLSSPLTIAKGTTLNGTVNGISFAN